MENQALVATDGTMVAVRVTPEVVDAIISISDADVLWLKISEGGFLNGDVFMAPELTGVIFDIKPYWIRWSTTEAPEKIPFRKLEDQPEGFELRTDLKVSLRHGELIGLSLAPSSARNFSRYLRRLQGLRLLVSEVVTIMRPRSVTNKMKQKFCILDFEVVTPTAGSYRQEPERVQEMAPEPERVQEMSPEPERVQEMSPEPERVQEMSPEPPPISVDEIPF